MFQAGSPSPLPEEKTSEKLNKKIPDAPQRVPFPLGKMAEQTALLDALFYNLKDGVAVTDEKANLFYLNPAAKRMCQGEAGKVNPPDQWGTDFSFFRVDGKTPLPLDEIPLVVAMRGEVVEDCRMLIRNDVLGFGIHVSINAAPLFDANGNIAGAISMFRDITDLITVKEQLSKHAQELTRSNTELEKFAYIASHDLKEPLRMVSNYVRLLQRRYESKLDATGKEFIGFALDGAERMYAMIDALLEYSRLSYRAREVTKVSLNLVLQTAMGNLRAALEETGARVEVGDLPIITGNPHRLLQLFQNLISNAVKFRSAEPPVIKITFTEDGENWLFRVQDNGIGIDPQFHERIFDIFQRVHGRTEYPGNGIGLSICKKIVESYGGQMWVESEPGRGSTFVFSLPAGE